MKTIRICKAKIIENDYPEPVTVIIDGELPDISNLKQYRLQSLEQFYQDEAELLVDALWNSLPQGTFDRLGIEFMEKKISLYRGRERPVERGHWVFSLGLKMKLSPMTWLMTA
jgi:hypothetical protein